jgi:hypothetical protein
LQSSECERKEEKKDKRKKTTKKEGVSMLFFPL